MKEAVAGELAAAYHSGLVDAVRASDYRHVSGRLTLHLAREFGFCYGVDRAVDYAYQARRRFPERNVFLTGEIIHNPHVNERLRSAGIRFLSDRRRTRARARIRRRGDPPGVRRHGGRDAPAHRARLHAGGHDLRVGAQRVEERRALRPGRLHRRHPRQIPPRGDPRDRLTSAEVSQRPLSHRRSTVARPRASATTSVGAAIGRRSSRASSRRRLPASIPTSISRASAAQTRRRC